jgi:hypothetical protein
MNNHLINLYNATGLNRVVDSLSVAPSESSELPLGEVLIISRVLFAVVMIGFVGYFFDRMKQSVLLKSDAKIKDDRRG